MSSRALNKNNVMAGSFVISGVLLAVVFAFILGDFAGKLGSKKTYVIRFPTQVGVMGLQNGAEVTFAGMSVGTVVSVGMHYVEDEASGARVPAAMDVEIKLESDLVLFEDAVADLAPPILGGVSRINIASAGTGMVTDDLELAPDPGGVLDEGETINGRFAPSILRQMGLGPEETQKILDVIGKFPEWSGRVSTTAENVEETSASVRRMAENLEPNFNSGVDDGRTTMANIREFSDAMTEEGGWKDRIDSTMVSVDEASAKIGPAIDDATATMTSVRETVDENREKVGRILDNVEASTERVRFETIDKANALLADGALALGSARETIGDVQGVIAENRTTIGATMVNARQISLNGKLFLEEIRSQPWRLLSKPTKKDLKREPLYDAARTYAGAVSELRSASESLDTAVRMSSADSSQSGDEFAAELLRLASVVEKAYGRYEHAERGLLGLLAESP
jgi:ABC-type transporter Mla subunit MlaD